MIPRMVESLDQALLDSEQALSPPPAMSRTPWNRTDKHDSESTGLRLAIYFHTGNRADYGKD